MLGRQQRQRVQRAVPIVARLVRIDCRGIDHLACGIDYGHFHAGAQARIQAHRRARAGGCGQQQGLQVARKYSDRLDLGLFAQRSHQLGFEVHEHLDAPGPAHRIGQPFIRRAALVRDTEARGDAAFAGVMRRIPFRLFFFAVEAQDHHQHFFAAAAEQGQCAVRGDGAQGFRIIEIVGELFAGFLLALDHLRLDHAMLVDVAAQILQQRGVFGEALHQDLARAIQCSLAVCYAGIVAVVGREGGLEILGRFLFGVQRRVA